MIRTWARTSFMSTREEIDVARLDEIEPGLGTDVITALREVDELHQLRSPTILRTDLTQCGYWQFFPNGYPYLWEAMREDVEQTDELRDAFKGVLSALKRRRDALRPSGFEIRESDFGPAAKEFPADEVSPPDMTYLRIQRLNGVSVKKLVVGRTEDRRYTIWIRWG